jgi:predicted DNA-binding transcriptional regulator AlpA
MTIVTSAGPRAARRARRCQSIGPGAVPRLLRVPTPERHVHEGRAVINRAELMRQLQVGESTAERWYRERAENGHPEPVHREGRRLYWDEDELIGWARDWIARDAEPRQKVVEGRALLSRAELARRLNMREQTLADLYAARETSGHPQAVHREGRRLYWDEAEAVAWAQEREAAKKATLTPVDRSGEPDELVDAEEAARILGYASPRTITSYLARNVGYFPDPDDVEGRRWHRRTLWAFADRRSRPGRAGHAKTRSDQR